jgi:hypothetical protein
MVLHSGILKLLPRRNLIPVSVGTVPEKLPKLTITLGHLCHLIFQENSLSAEGGYTILRIVTDLKEKIFTTRPTTNDNFYFKASLAYRIRLR